MQVGRKPKPTSLKLLAGNPGKRKINDSEPHFDLSQPSPPPFLSDDAKVEWGRMSGLLYDAGVMTEADGDSRFNEIFPDTIEVKETKATLEEIKAVRKENMEDMQERQKAGFYFVVVCAWMRKKRRICCVA